MNYLIYIDSDGDFVILPEDHGIELKYDCHHGSDSGMWAVTIAGGYLSCSPLVHTTKGSINMRMDGISPQYQRTVLGILGFTQADSNSTPRRISQEEFDKIVELIESIKKSESL